MVFIFISVLGSMGFLAFPVITSLKSNNVSQKEQGLVQVRAALPLAPRCRAHSTRATPPSRGRARCTARGRWRRLRGPLCLGACTGAGRGSHARCAPCALCLAVWSRWVSRAFGSLTKGAGSPVHLPQAVFYVGALFAAAALAVATTLPNSGQAKDLASPVPQESDGSEDGEAEAEGGSVDPEAGSEPSPAQRAARRGSE